MQNHIELCREILLKLDHDDEFPLNGRQDADLQIDDYAAYEIAVACKDLVDFGFLDGTTVNIDRGAFIVFIHDFQPLAKQFIEHSRSESVWRDFKETVQSAMGQISTHSIRFMLANFMADNLIDGINAKYNYTYDE
ncbi:MAG: DUF2513 domain-containing protein [Calditrichaeota bacterium]|nr:DUF2513 domain-containing protein [Calditrichota bacterium]